MKLLEKISEIINWKSINVSKNLENFSFNVNVWENELSRYAIMKEIEEICKNEIEEIEIRNSEVETKELSLKKKEQQLQIELEYNVDLLKKQIHLEDVESEKERMKLSIENIELKEKVKELKKDVEFFKNISWDAFKANNEALIESSKRTVNITNNAN